MRRLFRRSADQLTHPCNSMCTTFAGVVKPYDGQSGFGIRTPSSRTGFKTRPNRWQATNSVTALNNSQALWANVRGFDTRSRSVSHSRRRRVSHRCRTGRYQTGISGQWTQLMSDDECQLAFSASVPSADVVPPSSIGPMSRCPGARYTVIKGEDVRRSSHWRTG